MYEMLMGEWVWLVIELLAVWMWIMGIFWHFLWFLIVGFPPFCSEKPQDTYRKIMNWQQHLIFSPELPPISPDAESLIRT